MRLDQAYDFLHRGSLALAQVEHNGIRVDTDYLKAAMSTAEDKIKYLEDELRKDDLFTRWKRVFRDRTQLGSKEQLACMIFTPVGLNLKEKKGRTKTGRIKADKDAFDHVDHPFIKAYFTVEKLKKVLGTYLKGIWREVVDGYLHPVYNLHLVSTYRSSCSDPNFQNIPIRDPEMGELIRRAFIARDGHRLADKDFVAIEVRVAACYHKDPTMLKYINDPSTDMHRDMATALYCLGDEDIPAGWWKDKGLKGGYNIRFAAKSFFVFAEFYGDYFMHCAPRLWEAIDKFGMHAPNGLLMRQHLANKGIKALGACDPEQQSLPGTYEYHVKRVEDHFWNNRFAVYSEWKKRWFDQYQRRGWFDMLTGFRVSGYHKRNDVINYPIQGAAFHCLLWALIELQNRLNKYKMKTKIVGQIHDSILSDIHESETQDYLEMAHDVMTIQLPKAWKWINVPLEVEMEVSPVDGNWYEKSEWVKQGGLWQSKKGIAA